MLCKDADLVERLSNLPAEDLRSVLGFLGAPDREPAAEAPLPATDEPTPDPET